MLHRVDSFELLLHAFTCFCSNLFRSTWNLSIACHGQVWCLARRSSISLDSGTLRKLSGMCHVSLQFVAPSSFLKPFGTSTSGRWSMQFGGRSKMESFCWAKRPETNDNNETMTKKRLDSDSKNNQKHILYV